MPDNLIIHYDNFTGFEEPVLFLQGEAIKDTNCITASNSDPFGISFEIPRSQKPLLIRFGDNKSDAIESESLYRRIESSHMKTYEELWCRSWNPFLYIEEPTLIEEASATDKVESLSFVAGIYRSDVGGHFGLGASVLQDGGVLFSVFHPHAAHIYVTGDFNEWQHPGCEAPDPSKFCKMTLHKGYFDVPNVWLLAIEHAQVGQTYKFYIEHKSLAGEHIIDNNLMVDPYARYLGDSYERNDGLIVDPSQFEWHDINYQTPDMHDLIIYELHVHGFTHEHPDIKPEHQETYQGIIDRIESGYFDQLGITCLYLMPISEVPTPQREDALGYNASLFMAVERDYGSPDDLRRLVDTAHRHNLAVIIDQVFNHAANSWNPLWKFILDHPDEMDKDNEGGLYFSGESPWGNRISTERTETQNMLIDACKLFIIEYHLDGFRFDATHTHYMDHGFLHRLADELKALKSDVVLIVENLPNQTDLNRNGYDGFAQWCDPFHDTIKALLRESDFENTQPDPHKIGDLFYFSKNVFAAHTNNVINYCESHDEHSVAHEVSFVDALNTPQAKERKARLGLFSTMVALGQPMMYMGQEFNVERERNLVYFDFPEHLEEHGFFQWASRLIKLRQRYAGLKLHGFNPIEQGQFQWVIGSWLGKRQGQGKRVLGWRAIPNDRPEDQLVILLNFENHPVEVDVNFGMPGIWLQLAYIDRVNDIEPIGTNSIDHDTAYHLPDGMGYQFVLPDSSGFIYKWQMRP